MQQAAAQLKSYYPIAIDNLNAADKISFDAGAAGTVFRFLSLRLSRIPGVHILKGTKRLMQRPQQDLLDVFARLGVEYELFEEHILIKSKGWQNISQPIEVKRGVSSQFASGLILNAWNLDQDLILKMSGNPISEGYLEMTVQVVKELGMQIESIGQDYRIPARSQIAKNKFTVESDLSSAFAVAAFAALNGEACFQSFPLKSLQPDVEFIEILGNMNVAVDMKNGELIVKKTGELKGVEANLKSCPDLFPVLATLCAFATGPSRLYGAPQLVYKESDRISKISELLTKLKIKHEKTNEGMIIHPHAVRSIDVEPFSYDTDHDHRLAFSAALVKSQGIRIEIIHPEVVSKSFPEFWKVVGMKP